MCIIIKQTIEIYTIKCLQRISELIFSSMCAVLQSVDKVTITFSPQTILHHENGLFFFYSKHLPLTKIDAIIYSTDENVLLITFINCDIPDIATNNLKQVIIQKAAVSIVYSHRCPAPPWQPATTSTVQPTPSLMALLTC